MTFVYLPKREYGFKKKKKFQPLILDRETETREGKEFL